MKIIKPMAEGGQWLAMGGTGEPHYVVNPDHVTRLLREGYQVVLDPRISSKNLPDNAYTVHESGEVLSLDTAIQVIANNNEDAETSSSEDSASEKKTKKGSKK